MIRNFIFLLFFSISLLACESTKTSTTTDPPPNIVFIFADDMGYGDVKCYNPDSKIATRNIDKLAEQGMRFTDAHAPAAVCVPSRYSLLTGQYPFLNDRKYQEGTIEPGRPTLASLLNEAGYQTACIGKWHQGIIDEKNPPPNTDLVGGPIDHGFDYFYGMPASLDIQPYYYIENKRPVALPTDTIAPMEGTAPAEGKRKIQGPFYRGGKVAPGFDHEKVLDKFGSKAMEYIQTAGQQKESPFFLYLALPAPHTPWLPAEKFKGQSGAGSYGDYVLQVDDLVGNVIKSLADQGLEDNTLVIFTSDNGPVWYPENVTEYQHNSVVPLAGMKGDAWEGGHRLPFIARWPGNIDAGTKNEKLICFTDIFATFADLTKVNLSSAYPRNSNSILPLLLDADHAATRSLFIMKSSRGVYAIRKGGWKLILAKGSGGFMDSYDKSLAESNPYEGQLYNLTEDISETTNWYAEYPDKVAELEKELEVLLEGGKQ